MVLVLSGKPLSARTFTDTNGRKVEAEVAGVRGAKVLLNVNGNLAEWPINQLSPDDQEYIKTWARNPPPTKIIVRTTEEKGDTSIKTKSSGSNQRVDTRRYVLNLYNQTYQDSGPLKVMAVAYTKTDNSVHPHPMSFKMSNGVQAREHDSLTTGYVSANSSKDVTYTSVITTYVGGGSSYQDVDIRKDTSRSRETFEGIWVRVFRGGNLVGEAKDLSNEVLKLDPAWTLELNRDYDLPRLLQP